MFLLFVSAQQIGLSFLLGVLIGFGAVQVGFRLYWMWKKPNLHLWPSVTRCNCCNKRVFVWQKKVQKVFPLKVEGDNLGGLIQGTLIGIVHARCKHTEPTNLPSITRKVTRH
jgi:hypothetical protein